MQVPFIPTQISGCILWLDASDPNVVTTTSGVGSQVQQIRNKGTLTSCVASNLQATGSFANPPWSAWPPPGTTTFGADAFTTSGLSTIRFTRTVGSGGVYGNGFNGSYLTVANLTTTQKSRTVFAIFGMVNVTTSIDNFFRVFATTFQNTNGFPTNYIDYGSAAWVGFPIGYSGSELLAFGGTAPFSGTLLTNGTPYIIGSRHTTSISSNVGTVNGTTQNNNANQALNIGYTTGTSEYMVGIGIGYTREFYLGELIYFDGAITDLQMRQMEGYLSWKWGNQSALPATHPYKSFPPTTTLSTLQLNLVNSIASPGYVILPSTLTTPGLTLTFKDQYGAFSTNRMILTTNNANQTIDSAITSTINGTRLGWQTLIAGNNNKWYTVGGTLINTINTSTLTSLNTSTIQISSGNLLTSTLAIRDSTFFSANTLVAQSTFLIYAAAGQSTIISGTRQSFGRVLMGVRSLFIPSQISGLNLWLDAADVNSLQLSGNVVSRWFDKSTNNFLGTPQNSPTVLFNAFNGLPAINFNGTNQYINFGNVLNMGTNGIYIFTVTKYASSADGSIIAKSSARGFAARWFMIRLLSDGGLEIGIDATGSGVTAPFADTSTALRIVSSYWDRSNMFLFTDGTQRATNVLPSATNLTNTDPLYVGAYGNATGTGPLAGLYFNGQIGEILVYLGTLTSTQRQQVEGYLAWKWGLVGSLPSTHPFKNAPP